MIKTYNIKQINKNERLHNESFMIKDDCIEVIQNIVSETLAIVFSTIEESGHDVEAIMDSIIAQNSNRPH